MVVDTETTGLSFKTCELIQIAAARMVDGQVQETFNTFIKPKKPIPGHITNLTGITNKDVETAPTAQAAVAQLASFCGGAPVLAHNATFDRTFIQNVKGGHNVSHLWIDTLALSRIALPLMASHKLQNLAEAFGCASVTHRAQDDVAALCDVWKYILEGLYQLPYELLCELSTFYPKTEWAYRPIITHIARLVQEDNLHAKAREVQETQVAQEAQEAQEVQDQNRAPLSTSPVRFSLLDERIRLMQTQKLQERADPLEYTSVTKAPSADLIQDAFSLQGLVGSLYSNYEQRPEQVAFAQSVREAFAHEEFGSIEAGTGVGKSMAYLVPAIYFAQQNNLTVGIATKTNSLTDQLIQHELPALYQSGAFNHELSFTALKGFDHYLCLLRLERALNFGKKDNNTLSVQQEHLELEDVPLKTSDDSDTWQDKDTPHEQVLTALATSLAFAVQAAEGDIDSLGIRWNYVDRSLLTCSASECARNKCPYFSKYCFVHGARKRAGAVDIMVTNHALLLKNIQMDGLIFPPVRYWIVDEAHGFEAEARKQWAREVSGAALKDAFEQLGSARTGVLHAVYLKAANAEDGALITRLTTKAAAESGRAQVACASYCDAVHNLIKLAPTTSEYDVSTLWLSDEQCTAPAWQTVCETGDVAEAALANLVHTLELLTKALASDTSRTKDDLMSSFEQFMEIWSNLKLVLSRQDPTYVYSAELYNKQCDRLKERLVAEKIDIGQDLVTHWYPQTKSVVYSSATIALANNFSHFNHAVGLDRVQDKNVTTLQLASSFDFEQNMAVYVVKDIPAPGAEGYLDSLCELLYNTHKAMDGSVLTLFTNRREMELLYTQLKPRLDKLGIKLLSQTKKLTPFYLREKFMANKTSSLFALKSFWQGFDAQGDTLRCVVIPRLPFASPSEPLSQERALREPRAWWRYNLPEAVIEVKQAAGRLIRSQSDTGVLILADSRLISKQYGRQFISSLPNPNAQAVNCEEIYDELSAWRRRKE